MPTMRVLAPLLIVAAAEGGLKTARKQYTLSGMDSTSNKVDVWYPTQAGSYPLISYSHGNTAGGSKTVSDYNTVASTMASYGYIVAAHESCDTGCKQGGSDILDPPGFKDMYKEQLKVIDWAKTQTDAVFSKMNKRIGVGVAGHSMGGQATMKSSSSLGSGHGVKAAVMHHAYTHFYDAPIVPFVAFTGSSDFIATPGQTQSFYKKAASKLPRAYVNKAGAGHTEPNGAGAALLGKWSAAWFKIYLDETPRADGHDYHEMILGTGSQSLCHGGDGTMTACEVHDGNPPAPTPAPTPAPAPTPSGLTCDQCKAQGHAADECNCGVCGSFGLCTFTCKPGGGRVACDKLIVV